MSEDRALAARLSEDRWVPSTAHVVLLMIVVLLTGVALPHSFLISWAAAIVVITLIRMMVAGRAQNPETDSRWIVRATRIVMIALGLAWGIGAALAARHLPAATFAMLLMALAGLLAGGINTLVADRWAFPAYALTMFAPPLVALPLLQPEPATSLEMLLIALFLFFMILQHRRAFGMLVDRQQADQLQRTLELVGLLPV